MYEFFRVSVSKLLTHLDTDHETEDFVRVEGGEYSSHFIVNEEDFTRSIMWISDQLHYNEKYFLLIANFLANLYLS